MLPFGQAWRDAYVLLRVDVFAAIELNLGGMATEHGRRESAGDMVPVLPGGI
jgi:hypothetical protein